MSGYHINKIERGTLGESTKIDEEYQELVDALSQDNKIMAIQELSDLLGAIEEFLKKFNLTLDDLIKMKDATKRAFENGRRND